MIAPSVPRARHVRTSLSGRPLRVAFLGPQAWLDGSCPSVATHALSPKRVPLAETDDFARQAALVEEFRPDITVVFDPVRIGNEQVGELPGTTLGVLVGGLPEPGEVQPLHGLDRVVSFRPALTGSEIPGGRIWRAIPPPVSDTLFGEIHPLHHSPRAMAIGRSTPHRETMLLPAKHHHDLLHVIHGVTGPALVELLREYDVGIYFPPHPGGGFGQQVGMHLAAGQLLLTETLVPTHGLERNIDYLHVEDPEELVWMLDRLGRFPEMYERIRVRGRLKAEQYRASRVFSRIAHDLLADVAAFGPDT